MKRLKFLLYSVGALCACIVFTIIFAHLSLSIYFRLFTPNFVNALTESELSAYGNMSKNAIEQLLRETYLPGWRYDELTGFAENARTGKYVNVSSDGVRKTKSDEIGDIWFFGGSTTFGYGVADWETIPARLGEYLEQDVTNFGRGYYYSAQENVLLEKLLSSGRRPKVAIFLDGLNERCSVQYYQKEMQKLFARASSKYDWEIDDIIYPVSFTVHRLEQKFLSTHTAPNFHKLSCTSFGKEIPLSEVFSKNIKERVGICKEFNLICYTFFQPFAGVDGIHQDYAKLSNERREALRMKKEHLLVASGNLEIFDISEAINGLTHHSYVDDVHYSSEASSAIALAIYRKITQSNEYY